MTLNHQPLIISNLWSKNVGYLLIRSPSFCKSFRLSEYRTSWWTFISRQCRSCKKFHLRRQITNLLRSNWTRYPISVQDFRAAYASVCACASGASAASPQDVRFLPLLFVVLAIAVRLAPESIAGDARTRRITSLRYYWSCKRCAPDPRLPYAYLEKARRSLLIAVAVQPDSLDMVLTRLLVGQFSTESTR